MTKLITHIIYGDVHNTIQKAVNIKKEQFLNFDFF